MASLEKAESTAEILGVAFIAYLVWQAAKKIGGPGGLIDSAKQSLTEAGFFADVTGPAQWVGTGKALTPQQVDSITKFVGLDGHGGGFSLSPDGTQIWFYDGSFFDNTSGHFFSSAGIDEGGLA